MTVAGVPRAVRGGGPCPCKELAWRAASRWDFSDKPGSRCGCLDDSSFFQELRLGAGHVSSQREVLASDWGWFYMLLCVEP